MNNAPMINITGDFPIYTLDERLQQVIWQAQQQTQAPLGLIASSVLGAMSLACQDMADVSPKEGLVHTTSLFLITLGDSGERKTAVDELIMKPFRSMEQACEERYRLQRFEYDIELSVWQTEQKAYKGALIQAIKNGEDISACKQALKQVEANKPSPPSCRKWILNDVTSAAIKHAIGTYGHSVGVFSDESAHLFSSDFMRDTSVLNSLWGGKPISAARASNQKLTSIDDYRFSLSMMVQSKLFERFLERQGEKARESGFFARCLVCQPDSTQGTRFLVNDSGVKISKRNDEFPDLAHFHQMIEDMLNDAQQRHDAGKPRVCLTLSPAAREKWFEMANRVERQLGNFGEWREFRDFASKFMEHASRIAAVLECFTTRNTEISALNMHAGISIVEWYFQHFVQLFSHRSIPDDLREMNELERWLEVNPHRAINGLFKKNDIRRFGPNCVRNAMKLDRALQRLCFKGGATLLFNGRMAVVKYHPPQIKFSFL
ncbi:YfjI family protein [Aeromonas rivuli]|uniref:YfjI family protein n=1 Tax=Aeromonas rivuli TaxID=648794 RepID=UPI001CCE62FF|nr:YfjI family protein [Aeromonas rivuli]UBO72983.1 DUF3987 domain-containing protein [Aeromonas rivuli]